MATYKKVRKPDIPLRVSDCKRERPSLWVIRYGERHYAASYGTYAKHCTLYIPKLNEHHKVTWAAVTKAVNAGVCLNLD